MKKKVRNGINQAATEIKDFGKEKKKMMMMILKGDQRILRRRCVKNGYAYSSPSFVVHLKQIFLKSAFLRTKRKLQHLQPPF